MSDCYVMNAIRHFLLVAYVGGWGMVRQDKLKGIKKLIKLTLGVDKLWVNVLLYCSCAGEIMVYSTKKSPCVHKSYCLNNFIFNGLHFQKR